jgi:hypothetical protein
MNKKQQRSENLQRHYLNLCKLYEQTTGEALAIEQGKKLSNKLRKLEALASIETVAQCNGYYIEPTAQDYKNGNFEKLRLQCTEEGAYPESDKKLDKIIEQVQKLFKGQLKGFFINYDARGYALKIKAENCPLSQDFGGYYILSPEID